MEIYSFEKKVGKKITKYDSDFVMNKILHTENKTHIACMHLKAGGIVGLHEAIVPQLLLVVQGEATVTGKDNQSKQVYEGDAVFWEKGELHKTVSKHGMMAIVIEGESLNPGLYMPVDS
ncbi:cupin [Cerasibacillus terrae]|uniref:Cupin n=1 Tax=Cerasibacillus terrae TaxID=2498845 RepID=A0A5C8NRI3_9BACI|nr:cupin [Cerasibacillus terrae]TXL63620.1 cupin [Cerasibacillus terrae]